MKKKVKIYKLKFPVDQIGEETLARLVGNVDKFAKVFEKAVWNKASIERLRDEFFEVYDYVKYKLFQYRDRLGNILPQNYEAKYVPNSWIAIAKEKGVRILELPKNEYDLKLDAVKAREKDNNWGHVGGHSSDEELESMFDINSKDYIGEKIVRAGLLTPEVKKQNVLIRIWKTLTKRSK